MDIEDKEIWDNIQNSKVLGLFQFDSLVGSQALKLVHPSNILELSDSNGLSISPNMLFR